MDYKEADALLQGRNRYSRNLPGRNTYLVRRGENIAIQLHNTDVVTFRPNGEVVLNSGGWQTSTTKDRINLAVPLIQRDYRWPVYGKPFQDGMVVRQKKQSHVRAVARSRAPRLTR